MYQEDMRELERLIARRREMRAKLADSCDRRKAAKERGDEKTIMRERIKAAYCTNFITRLNDEIFALGKALGVDPEELGAAEDTH